MFARPRRPAGDALPPELDRILHDLRGPLNAMAMHLEVLKHLMVDDGRAQQSLDTVERAVRRLTRMLPAALSVVALERGAADPIELRALVESALHEPGLAGVKLVGDHWPEVRGDRDLLGLAVAHLLRNAQQATAAAPDRRRSPEVHAEMAGGFATLVFRDWGVGLPRNPRSIVRLAEDAASGRQGLGLLIAERVARLHGGALEFARPSSASTDVRLSLPLA
jgi:signal transduction histidine kinase